MDFLNRSVKLAESRGYLAYPEVLRRSKRMPDWFVALGTPRGRDRLSARLGSPIPKALIEYYSLPLVASFLEFAVDGFVLFEQAMQFSGVPCDRFPVHLQWDGADYVAILDHPHSGTYLGASLDAPDPKVAHGEPLGPDFGEDRIANPDVPNATILEFTFSEWVFGVIDGYEKKLDFWEAAIRKVDTDPRERARVGDYSYFRTLPGMKERLKRKDG